MELSDWEEEGRRWSLTPEAAHAKVTPLLAREAQTRSGMLNLSDYPITELPAEISTFHWLTKLYCAGTKVTSLEPLRGLTALTTLKCYFTKVTSLEPLRDLTALTALDCANTKVTSLEPLRGLTSLTMLDCGRTEVNSLEPLRDNEALEMLRCEECPITDIPPEKLSRTFRDNCLPRVRAHWAEMDEGAAPYRMHKLFLLGNGVVGKTQLARRLRGLGYDEGISSTHGIELADHDLPGASGAEDDSFTARIWDFGGQDIYHGTHALFLKTRAVFLLCWNPQSEAEPDHVIDGMTYKNRPLDYWLDYVRELAGPDAAIILVQTQCDSPASQRAPGVDPGKLEQAAYVEICHTSARTGRGLADLKEKIAAAVAHIEGGHVPQIGTSEIQVMAALSNSRTEDGVRTLSQPEFAGICETAGYGSDPKILLDFLHQTGDVFYRPGLFGDRIILDQTWALDAIYALFNRDKVTARLINEAGFFTPDDLHNWLWHDWGTDLGRDALSDDDQTLLLDMMITCGMAFPYDEETPGSGTGTRGRTADPRLRRYIAPHFLPLRDDHVIRPWINPAQDRLLRASLRFPLLHEGIMRAIMAEIGGDAQRNAIYWQRGVLFFDRKIDSNVLIEAIPDETGWAGTLEITVRNMHGSDGLRQITDWVIQLCARLGVEPGEVKGDHLTDARPALRMPDELQHEETTGRATGPLGRREGQQHWYVSYAWGEDETEQGRLRQQRIEDLCEQAERDGVALFRDVKYMRTGDLIEEFIKQIQTGDRIICLISEKYLHSPFCMQELSGVWMTSGRYPDRFRQRLYCYADVNFHDLEMRERVYLHWEDWIEDKNTSKEFIDGHLKRRIVDLELLTKTWIELAGSLANILHDTDYEAFLSTAFGPGLPEEET